MALVVKNLPAKAGDAGDSSSIPGLRNSPGEGNSNPLQYSCLGDAEGQGDLAHCNSWGHKESDMIE